MSEFVEEFKIGNTNVKLQMIIVATKHRKMLMQFSSELEQMLYRILQ